MQAAEPMLYKFYFYIYDSHKPPETKISLDTMLFVGEATIDSDSDIPTAYNSLLREFLIKNNIRQFVPLKRPSIEFCESESGHYATICYYHNKTAYDNIYRLYPDYICMPTAPLEEQFHALYLAHGLTGWYDPRSNTLFE